MRCLVTGATGYIGGRLAPRLLDGGHEVRCLTRSAGRLRGVPWVDRADVAEADLLSAESLRGVFGGIDVAYYLVHSLGAKDFEDRDHRAAQAFAQAAAQAGVRRIVYLGGPAVKDRDEASAHLRSRSEVAEVLASTGVPTVILRAAVIIGSGSASFEMLRHLTERLPIMVAPRWVGNRTQPIAVRDVLHYLVGWATAPGMVSRSFDICGPDVLTYAEMMRRYARVVGLPPRVILPVRALSPWLSSLWVGLITPVPGPIATPLVESLIHEAVCHEHDIAAHVPDPPGGLKGFEESVRLALAKVRDADAKARETPAAWTAAPADPLPTDPAWSGATVYLDRREQTVRASPETLWRAVVGAGGETGWHSFPLARSLHGWLDRPMEGVSLRRGRRDHGELPADGLHAGEALDFWRVEKIEPGRLLRLRAEMPMPGRAWLEMSVEGGQAGSVYRQRTVFMPHGLAGLLYWRMIAPFQAMIFGGMARDIAGAAERAEQAAASERR